MNEPLCALAVAAQHADGLVLPGGFVQIEQVKAVEFIVGINSAAAHLLTPAARAGAPERSFRTLVPGGVVLLDLPNFLWILEHYRLTVAQHTTIGGRVVELQHSHEVDVHAATFTTRDEYFVGEQRIGEMGHLYGISTWPEWQHQLQESGFVELGTYNGYGARQTERFGGARMLFSGRRPG